MEGGDIFLSHTQVVTFFLKNPPAFDEKNSS